MARKSLGDTLSAAMQRNLTALAAEYGHNLTKMKMTWRMSEDGTVMGQPADGCSLQDETTWVRMWAEALQLELAPNSNAREIHTGLVDGFRVAVFERTPHHRRGPAGAIRHSRNQPTFSVLLAAPSTVGGGRHAALEPRSGRFAGQLPAAEHHDRLPR